ncbi:MAG TPA: PH domain-containing protein [Tepidisphaeraceae bacterium]|nr:PH domain-containing protein [Tepidisphaeraceae bacterium]
MTQFQPPLAADDRPHRPADDAEVVYYNGSPMLRAEAGTIVVCTLVAAAIIAGCVFASMSGVGAVVWLIGLPAALVIVLVPVLIAKKLRYRITNYRIDYEHGLLSKTIETLELWHVEDIKFHQSVLDRLLHVGTVTVLSHDDTTPKLTLRGLPDPRGIFDSLKQRIIAVKRQRGVIKMDMGSRE